MVRNVGADEWAGLGEQWCEAGNKLKAQQWGCSHCGQATGRNGPCATAGGIVFQDKRTWENSPGLK